MLIRLQFPNKTKMIECVLKDRVLRYGDELELVHLNGNLSFRGAFHVSHIEPNEAWYKGEIPPNHSFAELVFSVKEVLPTPPTPESL